MALNMQSGRRGKVATSVFLVLLIILSSDELRLWAADRLTSAVVSPPDSWDALFGWWSELALPIAAGLVVLLGWLVGRGHSWVFTGAFIGFGALGVWNFVEIYSYYAWEGLTGGYFSPLLLMGAAALQAAVVLLLFFLGSLLPTPFGSSEIEALNRRNEKSERKHR
ncbi:MAG: hypothetical protein C4521_10555 [Actinobacteria bacterium]|nr:MAG: hypothetical protein C4521_10555 [Actinomycetota bacterium]